MKFDEILKEIGEFGLYQKIQFALVFLPTIFTAMHSLSWTFTAVSIPHRCILLGESESDSFLVNNVFYTRWLYNGKVDKKEIDNKCQRLVNFTGWQNNDTYFYEPVQSYKLESCTDGHKWDTSVISNTAFKKWEMICSNMWMKSMVQSVYYVGQGIGSLVFGITGDKIGRKKVFFLAILMQVCCGAASAYVPYWQLFAVLRLLLGFAHPGIFSTAIVIGVELVGPSYRILSSVAAGLFFATGEIFLGALAYAIRDYQHLQLTITLPALIFLAYWWVLPESARWLLVKKKFDKAGCILERAARVNKRNLPKEWQTQLEMAEQAEISTENNDKRKPFYSELLKNPVIRKRALVCFLCWPSISAAYYGLSVNPNFLGGDLYLTFICGACLEILALVIVLFTINFVGRKKLLIGGLMLASCCLFTTLAIPDDYEHVRTVFVIVGKMFVVAVYATIYVMTTELFPVVIRSTVMGACSTIGYIGSVFASFVALWVVEMNKTAVIIVFGSVAFIAGVSGFFLPETNGLLQSETWRDFDEEKQNISISVIATKKETTNETKEERKPQL